MEILTVRRLCYAGVRIYVNLTEFFITWYSLPIYANKLQEGNSSVISISHCQCLYCRRFRDNLRRARSFGEWKAAAADLDQHLSNDVWCEEDEFAYYDYHLIRRGLKNLKTLRESGNMEELKAALEGCIKANFGKSLQHRRRLTGVAGIESPRLYSQTYYGTKRLVEEYVDEGISFCID